LEDCSLGGVPLNTKDKNIFKNSKDNSSAISFLEETRFIIQNFTVFMTKKFTNLITIFPMETYYYLQPFPKTDKLCTQEFGELELTLDLYEEKLPAWIKAKFVQRRATSWILQAKRGENAYKQRLITLGLLPLCYEREIKDLVFFFKALYGHMILTCIVSFHLSTMAEHGLIEILLSHSKFLSVNPKHFNPPISTGLSSYGTTSAKFFPLPPSPPSPSSKYLLKPLTLT
jgi:hypothetical protein